jgi:hypothetical protein
MRVAQLEQINEFRVETWRWQSLMRKPRTPTSYRERRSDDERYVERIRDLWRARARTAEPGYIRRTAGPGLHPPLRAQSTQGWKTRTGNGYYGGLQMDIGFQRPTGLNFCAAARRPLTPVSRCGSPSAPTKWRGFSWPNTARFAA